MSRFATNSKLWKFSLFIWMCLLVLTGTYIRVRAGIEMVETDWLVIVQILMAIIGGVSGLLLINKERKWGIGTIFLFVFVVTAGTSALFCPYPTKVIGYWILLLGVSVLTVGLVQRADNYLDLAVIEKAWLLIIGLIVFKDTLVAFSVASEGVGETTRLGMGITHANTLSFLAALAFWLTFGLYNSKLSSLLWFPRLFFLTIIFLSRTRMSMLAILIGGIVWVWFKFGNFDFQKKLIIRTFSICALVSMVIVFGWAFFAKSSFATGLFDWVNRSQDFTTLTSITGRTEIWESATNKIFQPSLHFLFGHGYGMSRFVINQGIINPSFFAYHAHNSILEALLAMGFFGGTALLIMLFNSLRWLFKFNNLQKYFTTPFCLRAATIITMIFIYILTESSLSVKISPIFIIFIFYLLSLDQKKYLIEK